MTVKGWCPGALAPMMSGDGLIVRLRLSGNEASPALLREIAGWSRDFGHGEIDLTARGNLQLRGLREAAAPELTGKMRAAGLLDASPAAEAVRNVLVAPLADCDPDAPLDVRPFARDWERELADSAELWRLPAKFAASFDAGAFPLGDESDLAFRAVTSQDFVVRLGGEVWLGPFAGERLTGVAKALARAFLAQRETHAPPRRMREAVRACGLAPFAQAARLPEIAFHPPPRRPPRDYLDAQPLGARAFVGLGLPFGRISAVDLADLAKLAQEAGGESLRLTPWRAILVPGLSGQAARALAERARRLPVILDPEDRRLGVAACPGAPACSSALGDTRAAAARLAPFAARALHVSGCAKGCAHPGPAPFTVVAAARGYDLVLDGRADAAPVACGLTLDALGQRLAALAPLNESAV